MLPFLEPKDTDNYSGFDKAFAVCKEQMAHGKGKERHGEPRPFSQQFTFGITRKCGIGFPVGQMLKKGSELMGFDDKKRQLHELAGAVNYGLTAMQSLMEEINEDNR